MAKEAALAALALRCVDIGVLMRQGIAEALLSSGLTPEQHELLVLIGSGLSSPQEIYGASGRDKTTLSRVLARATRAGLVSVERRSDDRRRQTVRLTESGVSKLAQTQRLLERAAPSLFVALSMKERRRLRKILRKVRGGLAR
jgi:DNA-binding MarR family transcriptional regulator